MTATDLRRRLAHVPARLFLAAALAFAGFAVIGVAIAQDGAKPCGDPDCLQEAGAPNPDDGTTGNGTTNCRANVPTCPQRPSNCKRPNLAFCCPSSPPNPTGAKVCDCHVPGTEPSGCSAN